MALLRFDNVSKSYPGGQAALSEMNFSVAEGEMLFVTGHSGAGKSTLLKLIHLSERPSRGTILVDERNLATVRGRQVALHRRKVGVVHQDHRLLLDRSVFDNVALPLLIAGLPSTEIGKRVRVMLDKVGLGTRERSRPRDLSTGEQQRVGIARAMVSQPRILLADEPTGNLDAANGAIVIDTMTALNAEYGTTLVLVTHDLDLAGLARRTIRLADGNIISDSRRVHRHLQPPTR